MKYLFLFVTVLCTTANLLAQSNNSALIVRDNSSLNPIPPTPEMASLGRFGNIDFEKSTGAPSFSVPIYTISYDGITIPLQLQFSSTGFRPSDVGSYLGMHWMLTGLGGISRQIKGQPDEDGYLFNYVTQSYINSIVPLAGSRAGQDSIDQYNKGLDISQDSYTLSANDLNGRFFINAQKQFAFSVKKDIKLFYQTSTGSGGGRVIKFWVLDTKGNKYEFDITERTFIASQNGYSRTTVSQDGITSWKLSKIITASGKEIVFNYSDYNFMYTNASSDVYTTASAPPTSPNETYNCGCAEEGTWNYGSNLYSFHSKVISSIVTPNETVSFSYADDGSAANYQKKLTQITVTDHNSVQKKKFTFGYGYYSGDARLKLTSFKSVDITNASNFAEYQFNYYENYSIPAPNTRNIDAAKYFNGSSNWHLLVASHADYPYGSADRSVQINYMRETLLKEVVYPTGGKTAFEYEPNGNLSSNDLGSGLRVKSLTNKATDGSITGKKEYVYRNFNGPPLLLNNVPYNTFPEQLTCNRWVFTSDNQWSTVQNTIPLSEDYFYEEVDVLEKGPGIDLKTTYKFTEIEAMEGDQQVRPFQELVYKTGSGYTLLKQKDFTYSTQGYANYSNSVFQFAPLPAELRTSWDFGDNGYEWCVYVHTGIAQSQPRFQAVIRELTVTEKTYEGADQLAVSTEMGYGSQHEMPISIKSYSSKGQLLEKKIFYAADGSAVSSPALSGGQLTVLADMVSKNILATVVAEELYRGGQLVDATRTVYALYHGSYYRPDEILDRDKSGSYFKRTDLLNYDTDGNLLDFRKEYDVTNAMIWAYKNSYPVARVSNADFSSLSYSSFESDGKGNWDYSNGATTTGYGGATGNYALNLNVGSVQRTGLVSSMSYVITYWKNDAAGGSTSVGGTALMTKNGWTLYQATVTGVTSITISGTAVIDELRLYPVNAQMTTYTYDPLIGMTSQCDANNRITYYEYDGFGRLLRIRDMDKNILKTFEYKYKEAQ